MFSILIPLSGVTPVNVTGTEYPSFFRSINLFGYSGFATGLPVNNTQPVYVGTESGKLPFCIATGARLTWDVPFFANKDSLARFWAKGTAGDSIFILTF